MFLTVRYLIKNGLFLKEDANQEEDEPKNRYDGFAEKDFSRKNDVTLEDCYSLLGCNESDETDTIKYAYKKKISEFHPDKIQGKGLSEAFMRIAEEESKKINCAYEMIRAYRGF